MHQLLPANPEEAFLTPLDVANNIDLSGDDLLRIYRAMSLIRQLDRRTKESKYPIAFKLIYRSVKAIQHFGHPVQVYIKYPNRLCRT